MKKKTLIGLITLLMVFGIGQAMAQSSKEFKLDVNSGKVVFSEVHKVKFVGYSGNGLLIKGQDEDHEESERAKGLKLISGLGLEDNTGIGLSTDNKGDITMVYQISRNSDAEYIVQVPKGVTIVYEHSSAYGDDVEFKDIVGEIEVTTNYSDVRLVNVTGPMTISTVHGDIDGNFSTVNQSDPISIVSSHGDIDLAFPATTKANLKIRTDWGEIYSDLDIKIEKKDDEMKRYSATDVVGTLNGGGVEIKIKSNHGSIYLRKK